MTSPTRNLAPLGRRLAAFLIDLAVIAVPSAFVWLLLDYLPHARMGPAWSGTLGEFLANLIVPWFVVAWGLGYLISWPARRGGTAGKQLLGLRVDRHDGTTPIGYGWATVRALGYALSALPLGLGFLWVLWDPDRRAWHDKLAGTVVVQNGSGEMKDE